MFFLLKPITQLVIFSYFHEFISINNCLTDWGGLRIYYSLVTTSRNIFVYFNAFSQNNIQVAALIFFSAREFYYFCNVTSRKGPRLGIRCDTVFNGQTVSLNIVFERVIILNFTLYFFTYILCLTSHYYQRKSLMKIMDISSIRAFMHQSTSLTMFC